jgi:hypothetical protein
MRVLVPSIDSQSEETSRSHGGGLGVAKMP